MSILEKLTEGIVNRDMKKEGAALLEKWERTGLLEGLPGDNVKNGMARLLENQAKELLRESASSMQGGDVEGFAAVAFPIVRRVFGQLIANELVSVQPMSLPSGLIFFLDFTYGLTDNDTAPNTRLDYAFDSSLYGGQVVGAQITGGVNLAGNLGTNATVGAFYNLMNGYSSPTCSIAPANFPNPTLVASGTFGMQETYGAGPAVTSPLVGVGTPLANKIDAIMQYDPDFVSGSTTFAILSVPRTDLTCSNGTSFNFDDLVAMTFDGMTAGPPGARHIRRLTQFSSSVGQVPNRSAVNLLTVIASPDGGLSAANLGGTQPANIGVSFPMVDDFRNSNAIGSVVGAIDWGLENNVDIPEINIKVDSVSVTAMTKKLKAKWTPELGQDLNAYHNLDAEVELTSILSEQIALEIDREIVEDLVKGATGGILFWSRSPGLFVDKTTGAEVGATAAAPDFTGTVSEWYETLLETCNDVSAQIHRKTLRGGANFLVTSPELANVLEFTAGFRASITVDDAKGTAGAQKIGAINKRYDVYVDPYFPRNLILVGRKGNSFLESGYVYAPYVPLQVTPTIFGIEDFVPRKGVMTRYAKKMVRPDMYGLVIVRGLLGESGSST